MSTRASTLDWYGCATFRLRTAEGLTVWLDAYLDRVPGAEQSGVTVDDVTTADWILVGHSHFDHLWGAERIAARTGATVVGSYESVRVLAAAGLPEEQLIAVGGGERVALDPSTSVRVLPGLHSCVWSSQPMPPADEVCLGETGLTLQERSERMRALWAGFGALGDDVRAHMQAADQGERGDGGALALRQVAPVQVDRKHIGQRLGRGAVELGNREVEAEVARRHVAVAAIEDAPLELDDRFANAMLLNVRSQRVLPGCIQHGEQVRVIVPEAGEGVVTAMVDEGGQRIFSTSSASERRPSATSRRVMKCVAARAEARTVRRAAWGSG